MGKVAVKDRPATLAATVPVDASSVPWTAVFAVEGVDTSDERRLAIGSTTWRELPLTLMAQSVTADGHDDARVAGRIDHIERVGNDIVAAGVFSSDEYGQQIASWVSDGTLRGVSIDLAADEWEIEPYPDTEVDPADAELVDLFGPAGVMVVTKGTIMGATITPFPAFAEASIMLASGDYDGKRRRVLRIGSQIGLAFPPAAKPAPGAAPAATATDDSTKAAIIADVTEVAQDYSGVMGQLTVTIDGADTVVKFPDAGSTDPDQAEDDAAGNSMTVRDAQVALAHAQIAEAGKALTAAAQAMRKYL